MNDLLARSGAVIFITAYPESCSPVTARTRLPDHQAVRPDVVKAMKALFFDTRSTSARRVAAG